MRAITNIDDHQYGRQQIAVQEAKCHRRSCRGRDLNFPAGTPLTAAISN